MISRTLIRRIAPPVLGLGALMLVGCQGDQQTATWAQYSPVLEPTRTFAAGEVNENMVLLGVHDADDGKLLSSVTE